MPVCNSLYVQSQLCIGYCPGVSKLIEFDCIALLSVILSLKEMVDTGIDHLQQKSLSQESLKVTY